MKKLNLYNKELFAYYDLDEFKNYLKQNFKQKIKVNSVLFNSNSKFVNLIGCHNKTEKDQKVQKWFEENKDKLCIFSYDIIKENLQPNDNWYNYHQYDFIKNHKELSYLKYFDIETRINIIENYYNLPLENILNLFGLNKNIHKDVYNSIFSDNYLDKNVGINSYCKSFDSNAFINICFIGYLLNHLNSSNIYLMLSFYYFYILNEEGNDIKILAENFIKDFNNKYKTKIELNKISKMIIN